VEPLQLNTTTNVEKDEVIKFWSTMWKNDLSDSRDKYTEFINEYVPGKSQNHHEFVSERSFYEIISFLPNWKAAGPDGIYNFFIKWMSSLHEVLYKIIKEICLDGIIQENWLYTGSTFLIPKGEATEGSHFRPITCMSNLYRLMTKCVTRIIQLELEEREIIA
jgi:hypothetical protein